MAMRASSIAVRSTVYGIALLLQACVLPEDKFEIVSVSPHSVSRSVFRDDAALWSHVAEGWKKEGDYLGFEVVTRESLPIAPPVVEAGSTPPIALIVSICDEGMVHGPDPRFLGATASGNSAYQKIIKYRDSDGDNSEDDLFERNAELCFYIQTLSMPISKRGNTLKLQLDEYVRRLAEQEPAGAE